PATGCVHSTVAMSSLIRSIILIERADVTTPGRLFQGSPVNGTTNPRSGLKVRCRVSVTGQVGYRTNPPAVFSRGKPAAERQRGREAPQDLKPALRPLDLTGTP